MGYGAYDSCSRTTRAMDSGYYTKSAKDIFTARNINNAMSPKNVTVRESRDSEEHPDSLAVVIALDLTGSMGSIPHNLVKDGLPSIIGNIQQRGIKSPQLLFLGVGDHECDRAPLQVGQFESSDELMDKWLTSIFLEGGGGGNDGESYILAWYFAGYRTAIDCYEKRKQKGFLFTIGDEPTLLDIPKSVIENLMGKGQYEDYDAGKLLTKVMEQYNVFHIHVRQGSNGRRQDVVDGWAQLLHKNLIIADKHEDIPRIIADKIVEIAGATVTPKTVKSKKTKEEPKKEEEPLQILL